MTVQDTAQSDAGPGPGTEAQQADQQQEQVTDDVPPLHLLRAPANGCMQRRLVELHTTTACVCR